MDLLKILSVLYNRPILSLRSSITISKIANRKLYRINVTIAEEFNGRRLDK
jgi:hypothetical protein